MTHKSSPIGNDIGAVFFGVDDKIINNHAYLKNTLLQALKKDNFNILDECEFEFTPKGYTVMFLLGESHATIHTYPEYNSFAFHLYTCRRADDGQKTMKHLKSNIPHTSIDTQERPIIVENSK